MCKQCVDDLERWHQTGELPPAWAPEPNPVDAAFDAQIDEINRELEAIESGCVEPPRLGWLINIGLQAAE